jgi:hypothetical protein
MWINYQFKNQKTELPTWTTRFPTAFSLKNFSTTDAPSGEQMDSWMIGWMDF